MDLARPRPPAKTDVNLAQLLGDIVLLQQEAHRERNIRFYLDLDPSIPPISGDEALLTRLFLNLIKNAAEAAGKARVVTLGALTRGLQGEHYVAFPSDYSPWRRWPWQHPRPPWT